jgi:drug/metabolite transporter (DMT)-like permease
MNDAESPTIATEQDRYRPVTVPVALLMTLCCFLWGSNSLAIKFSVDSLPPLGVAGLRFGLGWLVAMAFWRPRWADLRPNRSELRMIFGNSAIMFVQIWLLNWGTQKTLAASSTVMITAHVVFVAIFAPLVAGSESLTVRKIGGLTVCSLGLLAVFGDQLFERRDSLWIGDAAVLASAALLGLKIVYAKRCLSASLTPTKLLTWQFALISTSFLISSVMLEGVDSYQWRTSAVLGVLYQGLIVAGFCFITWMTLLQHHSAESLAVFSFTSPLFGVAISLLLRPDEHATRLLLMGAVFVAAGIYLVSTVRRAKAKESSTAPVGRSSP